MASLVKALFGQQPELQASNRELTTALDTQTATNDILRVISRSQTSNPRD